MKKEFNICRMRFAILPVIPRYLYMNPKGRNCIIIIRQEPHPKRDMALEWILISSSILQ